MPDHVGEQLPEAGDVEPQGEQMQPGSVPVLGAGLLSEADAADILRGIGDTAAWLRKREAYRLGGERAAERCSDSLAKVLNRAWERLAPALLQSMETSWPGSMALAVGLGFAFGPAVMEDIRESGKNRAVVGIVDTPKRGPEPVPAQPKPPVTVDAGGGLTGRRVL